MTIRCDESEWPIVRIVFAGALRAEEIDAYHADTLARMRRAEAAGEHFVVVGDARECRVPSSEIRHLVATFVSEHEELIRRTNLGTFWAMSNPAQRAAFAVVSWLQPVPTSIKGFSTLAEAEAAARSALARPHEA